MPPAGRRLAAAAACLFGLALLAPSSPGAAGAQIKTVIDIRSVPSAPEYRTDEPKGPGFLGSDAAMLARSLAGINKALGTSLRPDNRLSQLARWAYNRLGPDRAMSPESAFDILAQRLGLAEPVPAFLVMQAPDTPRLARTVSARLANLFHLADYTHIGGVAEAEGFGIVVVIALSRRPIRLKPVPRALSAPGEIELDGRLLGPFARPELAHTRPGGETRIEALGPGPEFRIRVDLAETGRHRLEIVAHGPDGPSVIINFPIYVGVPVDEAIETAAASKRAARPDQTQRRLFDLINADRAKAGLEVLTLDPELGEIALRHSQDMRDNDFVAHVSPTTGSSEERLLKGGIKTALAAENIGKGYSPDEIHRGLMDSPGHRGAILLPGATHVGIGVASKRELDRTTYFVTELFIRRIPALGPDAKALFRLELNGLREAAGLMALEEDAALTEIAGETAREFLKDPGLSRSDVMDGLKRRLEGADLKVRSVAAFFIVISSLEEGAGRVAADPERSRARRVGIGIAQGARPDLVPNSIVLVLIFAE